MLHRQPLLSGKWYPSGFDLLDREINNCFVHAEGPGELPSHRTNKRLLGVISPYGDYQEIGQVCAWAYKEIAESEFPDAYIILGKGGKEYGFFTSLFSGWQTPLGTVNVDKELGQQLMRSFEKLKNDYDALEDGGSIEGQLPFLQFANKDKLQEIKIIPLLINSIDYNACMKLGEAIAELGEKNKVCVIGSCNLYGDVGDAATVDALKRIDTKKIHDIAQVRTANGDFIVFMEAMKHMFARKGRLLNYEPGAAALSFGLL